MCIYIFFCFIYLLIYLLIYLFVYLVIYLFIYLGGDGHLPILHFGKDGHQSTHSLGSCYLVGIVIHQPLSTYLGEVGNLSANLVWEGMASDLFKRRWWFAFYLKGNYHLVMHLGRDGHQCIHSFWCGWPPIYPFIWEGMACNLHIHVWRHGNQSTHSFLKGWPPIFPCM